jgi:hypothetical protein
MTMYSVLEQAKTPLRDGQGMAVFRRLYLCDTEEDIPALPVTDAPGSGALVAEGGRLYLLDHGRAWKRADGAAGMGGGLWKS